MEQRGIGILSVSVVGLGCNNFGSRLDASQTAQVIDAALDSGINFLDTADIYGGTRSEEFIGRTLTDRRRRIVLATKFGMEIDAQRRGAHPDYVRQACAASLRRLATDYIDLYWLHEPDAAVPIAETLGALAELVAAGMVRQIGCSNVTAAQLREYDSTARSADQPQFVAVQNEYSLLHREPEGDIPEVQESADRAYPNDGEAKRGVLAECARLDIAFVPYFPLASGLLSGKYHAGQDPPAGTRLATSPRAGRFLNEGNVAKMESLRSFAEKRGHTLLELAISWLLAQRPVASVIAGATSPDQARANSSAGSWALSADELAAVSGILENRGTAPHAAR
jgi:aryl-alcohol dehydrogenase-like predicted oxidoreductase